MTRTAEDLEKKCRDLLRATRKEGEDATPATLIEREMELTLDHIQRLRRHDRRQRYRLLERECEIETRIMNLRPHRRNYLGNRWEERHKMINQLTAALVRMENHHRRVAVDYDKRMQALHDRLLRLMNMRDQLYLHDGHSEDTP
jgi:hypothetical protein